MEKNLEILLPENSVTLRKYFLIVHVALRPKGKSFEGKNSYADIGNWCSGLWNSIIFFTKYVI